MTVCFRFYRLLIDRLTFPGQREEKKSSGKKLDKRKSYDRYEHTGRSSRGMEGEGRATKRGQVGEKGALDTEEERRGEGK